jgi:hypothetical protein
VTWRGHAETPLQIVCAANTRKRNTHQTLRVLSLLCWFVFTEDVLVGFSPVCWLLKGCCDDSLRPRLASRYPTGGHSRLGTCGLVGSCAVLGCWIDKHAFPRKRRYPAGLYPRPLAGRGQFRALTRLYFNRAGPSGRWAALWPTARVDRARSGPGPPHPPPG